MMWGSSPTFFFREPMVLDGPFAETKEQLLGFYVIDCDDLEGALAVARDLAVANPGTGAFEIRPLMLLHGGVVGGMGKPGLGLQVAGG